MILNLIAAALAGIAVGVFVTKHYVFTHMTSGVCIRSDDGEVYLKLSEETQRALADPKTKMLYLKVINLSTRNKQTP